VRFTNPSPNVDAQGIADVLYVGPYSGAAITSGIKPFFAGPYQSVRIRLFIGTTPGTGCVYKAGALFPIYWTNNATAAGSTTPGDYNFLPEDYYTLRSGDGPQYLDVVADVKAPYFTLASESNFTAAIADTYVEVTGYVSRQPPLARYSDASSGIAVSTDGPALFSVTETLATNVAGTAFGLPLWSGRVRLDVSFFYSGGTGVITNDAAVVIYPSSSSAASGVHVPVTAPQRGSARYRGTLDLHLGRRPYNIQCAAAVLTSGTVQYWIDGAFYGAEDTA